MQPRVMITNGGAHSAGKQAEATAWKILDLIRVLEEPVATDNPDRAVIEAGREAARQGKVLLEPKLTALFLPYHQKLQDGARAILKTDGLAKLDRDRAFADLIDETALLAELNGLLSGASVFAAHFTMPEVQERVRAILDDEFDRVTDEEMSWYADEPVEGSAAKAHHERYFGGVKRNRNDPALRAYRERRASGSGRRRQPPAAT